jgi:glycerophosphoryl diester phosphodiesterase
VLVSAHRCGAGARVELENTRGFSHGTFVLHHDDHLTVGDREVRLAELEFTDFGALAAEVLRCDDVLTALASAGKQAHIDLKFRSPSPAYDAPGTTYEVQATRMAVDALGARDLVVTTLDDDSVLAVRTWADEENLQLLVGLSLGRSTVGMAMGKKVRVRTSEVVARPRLRDSWATVVVAHQRLARAGVRSFARRVDLPLLVWTVDDEDALCYWLRPGRAWLVTTNEPELALRVRAEVEERYHRAARSRAMRRRERAERRVARMRT